jgi:hypothetical protein
LDSESCGRRIEVGEEGAKLDDRSEAIKDPESLD